jgi:hypothetical protein
LCAQGKTIRFKLKIRAFPENVAFLLSNRKASKIVPLIDNQIPGFSEWASKHYWFTNIVLNKFERLRAAAQILSLPASDEGMAVLLSYFLAIRLCSRADQRSPKPFISKLEHFK